MSTFEIGADKPLAEDEFNLATAVILTTLHDVAKRDWNDEWEMWTTPNISADPWEPSIFVHVLSEHYRTVHDATKTALQETTRAFMARPNAAATAKPLPFDVGGLSHTRNTTRKAAQQ